MNSVILNQTVPQSVTELQTVLLSNRRISDQDAFFHPVHPDQLTPEEVGIDPTQLQQAVDLILTARAQDQSVVVFGDYDVDGVCATAILWETLHSLGVRATPFIPHRVQHGYGLSLQSVQALLELSEQPSLVITVDNGIVAQPAIDVLHAAGIAVIVTDHHQPETTGYPSAEAVVHSTQLCGSSVSWFLSQALQKTGHGSGFQGSHLDLVALATVADQVSVLGANRSFLVHGLAELQHTTRLGLRELLKVAGLEDQVITTTTIGFGIGPRINAMGRLKHGLEALRLLCTTNPTRAKQLAMVVNQTNAERQQLTKDAIVEAVAVSSRWKEESLIISASSDYHEGIIGLIAGKLTETFGKPSIVIAVGDKFAKASARSIADVNIVEIIRSVRSDLLEVGGHPMAAGFRLEAEKLALVEQRLYQVAREQLRLSDREPQIEVECGLNSELVSQPETILALTDRFAPFGPGNPEPQFLWTDQVIEKMQLMGNDGQHLKLSLSSVNSDKPLTLLFWNVPPHLQELTTGVKISFVGSLTWNEWRGRRTPQVLAKQLELKKEN